MNNSRTFTVSNDTTPELALFTGHSNDVVSVSFSPDGKTLASASYDRSVILWDVETGGIIRKLKAGEALNSVSFSPDGNLVAAADWDATRIWNARSGELTNLWDDRWGHLLFLADGRLLQELSYYPGELVLHDLSNGSTSPVWKEEENSLSPFAVTEDERLLVFASGPVVEVIDVPSNTRLSTMRVPPERMAEERVGSVDHFDVAISPDGKLVAAAGFCAIRLWRVDTGDCSASLQHNAIYYHSVAFSRDGTNIATGDSNGALVLWDVQAGECRHSVMAHRRSVRCLAYSPDGAIIATGGSDAAVKLWDAQTGEPLRALGGCHQAVISVNFAHGGRAVVSGHRDATTRAWSVESASLADTDTGFEPPFAVTAASPDGRLLATATGEEGNLSPLGQPAVEISDAESGELLHTLALSDGEGWNEHVASVAFSPDSTMLTIGHAGFLVSIWDLHAGDLVNWMSTSRDSVGALAFSPNGKTLAVGTHYDERIELFNTSNGRRRKTLTDHTDRVTSLAYSPNGRILASASADGTVRLWSAGGKLLATLLILPAPGCEELSNEWIIYTPEGHYDCSEGAERFIRWQIGIEILPAEAFTARFHRPDVLCKVLRTGKPASTMKT